MSRAGRWMGLTGAVCLALPVLAMAQDEGGQPEAPAQATAAAPAKAAPNTTAGEFTPGAGFDLIKTELGSLNISAYGLARYLNQLPGEQTFTDHLGRVRTIRTRNDINWHRTFIWLSGFFWRPELR
jgi:hypothetical protein